ncbi:MAG: hypothetical protein K2M82_02540 [Lachnospiraceae bacterium]|nr:hypothetical protein [Lachnospiraceae bacterium]
MQKSGKYDNLYQNLLDAGYTAEKAKEYERFAGDGNWNRLLRELEKQKERLLASLHESEKQIDCLDFLVYQINKKYKGEF